MNDHSYQLELIIEVMGRLGITVRRANLGGLGGGLCSIRGSRMLFIDDDAEPAAQLSRSIAALAAVPGVDNVYFPPVIREMLESFRNDAGPDT